MADIFISYCSSDRARVAALAARLEASGYSVWWDRNIKAGNDFAATIEREIAACKAVVVAWSAEAARSAWVRDEASYAQRKGNLVPLLLSVDEPPMGFRQVQALDFRHWRGDARAEVFVALLSSLGELVAHPAVPPPTAGAPTAGSLRAFREWIGRRRVAVIIGVALFAVGASALFWEKAKIATLARPSTAGEVEITGFTASPGTRDRTALAASYADAFRHRFSELGVPNVLPRAGAEPATSELRLLGDLARVAGKDFLTVQITNRESGTVLWSKRGEPSEGSAREANLAAFALKCALKRRDPARGDLMFSRYLYGCGHFLEGDMAAMQASGKDVYAASPRDPRAISFYAVADIALGYGGSFSRADHDRFIGEARRLAGEALALDPRNADALFAMGFTLDEYRYAEQEKWWRAAVDADVDGWGPGRYANFLAAVGRIKEAADMELRALEGRRTLAARAAQLIASTGDLATARQIYELARPLDPEAIASAELVTAVFYEPVRRAERLMEERPDVDGRPCLELVLAARRQERIDREKLSRVCGGDGEYSARVFALAGDVDGAYREIETEVSADHSRGPPHVFWPEMKQFLRDDRFWPLAARLKLVDYWLETDQWPDFCRELDLPFDCRKKALAAREPEKPAAIR